MPDLVLRKLASLFVDAFEIGSRKAERDVGDLVCQKFGFSLEALEQEFRGIGSAGLTDEQQKQLRERVSEQLASAQGHWKR